MNNNDQKFVRDSNSSLKLLTFQLSNVREYASASDTLVIMTVSLLLVELVPYFNGR